MSTVSILKTIAHTAVAVDAWIGNIKRLYKSSIVGLDTEWFKDRYTDTVKIGILQLCVEDQCLIVQMWRLTSKPSSLAEFLMDDNYTFAGCEVGGDLKKLQVEFGLHCARSMDLTSLAKELWTKKYKQSPSLKNLAHDVLGLEMEKDKKITRSNWRVYRLTSEQIEYAALDAYASYKLGVQFQHFLNNPSSTPTMDDNRKPSITKGNRKAPALVSSTYLTPYDEGYYSDDDSSCGGHWRPSFPLLPQNHGRRPQHHGRPDRVP